MNDEKRERNHEKEEIMASDSPTEAVLPKILVATAVEMAVAVVSNYLIHGLFTQKCAIFSLFLPVLATYLCGIRL